MQLGKLTVRNTKELKGPETRLCALIAAVPKVGKTTLAGSLDEFTRAVRGKPSLCIAVEAAEGGGTMSIADLGMDYVMPASYDEMDALIGALRTDSTYGGVILDNGTDYISRIVKPYALKFPSKEGDGGGTRQQGVPVRGDYQTMAECARKQLNALVNLTNENTPPQFRKDLIVTCLEREKNDSSGSLVSIGPDFPGALASSVAALFQSVLSIRTRPKVIEVGGQKVRTQERVLLVKPDGLRPVGDRSGIFQHETVLTSPEGVPQGLLPLWREWVKQFGAVEAKA